MLKAVIRLGHSAPMVVVMEIAQGVAVMVAVEIALVDVMVLLQVVSNYIQTNSN